VLIKVLLTKGFIGGNIIGGSGQRLKNVHRKSTKGGSMGKILYEFSVLMTALAMFWPLIYNNISSIIKLLGNPLFQSVVGIMAFGALAYLTFSEETSTAS
jgi:hypothetical protein